MVHVILQFVVHPAAALHLMRPVGRIQFRSLVELVVPHQLISLWCVVGSLFSGSLVDGQVFTGAARHDGDRTSAGLCHRISRNRDGDRTRLVCRILSLDREEVLASHGHAPLLACRRDIDKVGATFCRHIDGLWRDGQAGCGWLGIVLTPSAAQKGYGERE